MSTLKQPLSAIMEQDLLALVSNGVREDRMLDFKRDVYGSNDQAKTEFLADISAFANTSGGDIVIGMDEAEGAASALVGLAEGIDPDSEILRLQQMATAGIQPQLPSLDIKAVPLVSGRSALAVRIGRSYLPPHRVTFGGRNKFYMRGPGGRFEPDVDGLRSLFGAGPALGQRIRETRAERLAMIFAGETPVMLHQKRGMFILHLVPFSAVNNTEARIFDADRLEKDIAEYFFPGTSGLDYRVNFDGFVAHRVISGGASYAYTQTFRSGFAEVVTAGMVSSLEGGSSLLFMDNVAEALVWHATKLVPVLRRRGGSSPCSVLLTLAGVKGAFAAPANYERWFTMNPPLPLGRDVLSFVDVVIPEIADGRAGICLALKPILDQLAQSGGLREADPKWTRQLG